MTTVSTELWDIATPRMVEGGARDWPAFAKWNPQYLCDTIGERVVGVTVSDTGVIRWNPDGSAVIPSQQLYLPQVTFNEAAEWVEESAAGGPKYYVNQQSIVHLLPELLEDLNFDPDMGPNVTNLWFGSAGNVIPLHFDETDNIFVQVYGSKSFILFDPADTEHLYKYPDDAIRPNLSQVDLTAPDFDTFPALKKAVPIHFTLHAGDILALPARWWHHVVSETVSISVNRWRLVI